MKDWQKQILKKEEFNKNGPDQFRPLKTQTMILPIFICSDYWTGEEAQIEAINEKQAIEIFKDETGAQIVKCVQID
jgi:hypothetical protein